MPADTTAQELRFVIRSDLWERSFVVLFYAAFLLVILASIPALGLGLTGAIIGIGLVPVSMFGIFSSPTEAVVTPDGTAILWERYRLFMRLSKRVEPAAMKRLRIIEPSAVSSEKVERDNPKVDITYYVFLQLELASGKKLRLFGSGLTMTPLEQKRTAYELGTRLQQLFEIPLENIYRRKR